MTLEPFATPTTAQPSPGLAVGEGHFYSDGFRPGDLKYSYGVLEQLLQQNPGWQLADGTVTLQDGSVPPDLRDRFIVGAGGALALGATGGSATLASHGHGFTPPTGHGITQPAFAPPNEHVITQPVVATHGGTPTEVTPLPGSTTWVNVHATAVAAGQALAHSLSTNVALSNNTGGHAPSPLTRTTDVGLSNNHAGGSVDAVVGTPASLPPYAALYLLIKVY